MAQAEILRAIRAVVGSRIRSNDDRCRLSSPDTKAYSTAGQSCPDTPKCRSLALFRRDLCGADRRDSFPRAVTNVSHAAQFGPRTLLEIPDARRRSRPGTVVRTRSPHQLLDRKLLDRAWPADLCIRTRHPLC